MPPFTGAETLRLVVVALLFLAVGTGLVRACRPLEAS
jgi:hypothetical protein